MDMYINREIGKIYRENLLPLVTLLNLEERNKGQVTAGIHMLESIIIPTGPIEVHEVFQNGGLDEIAMQLRASLRFMFLLESFFAYLCYTIYFAAAWIPDSRSMTWHYFNK